MGRKQSREIAFKLLFALAFDEANEVMDEASLELVCEREEPNETEMRFITNLVDAVKNNLETIDKLIASNSNNFAFDRIFKIDLTALRMAIGEALYMEGEKGLVINAAVEFVKKYSTEKSAAFVNGLLSHVIDGKEKK